MHQSLSKPQYRLLSSAYVSLRKSFGIGGGGGYPPFGTFTDYVIVERDQVIRSPDHLDDIQASAWPLAGLTAWRYVILAMARSSYSLKYLTRATIINAGVSKDQNILVTGIGGGVALFAMQLCLAKGANVYVTSGSEEKIRKATSLGAKGGVNYKSRKYLSSRILGNLSRWIITVLVPR